MSAASHPHASAKHPSSTEPSPSAHHASPHPHPHPHPHASSSLPLRVNFFRSLPLATDTQDWLYATARQTAATSLHQAFNQQWRFVPPEKDGTQVRKDTSDLSASYRLVRAATVLRCQEHELTMVVSNTTTESWRQFVTKCVGKACLDTVILHSFVKPRDEDLAVALDDASLSENNANRGNLGVPQRASSHDDLGANGDAVVTPDHHKPTPRAHTSASDAEELRRRPDSDACSARSKHAHIDEEDADYGAQDREQDVLTVKWTAFELGVGAKRDLCVVDYFTEALVPHSDHHAVVRQWCCASIEGERVGCMTLKDVPRAALSSLGLYWRRLSEEETEVILCGSFPSKHTKRVSALLLSSLARLQGIVEDLRLSHQVYLHRETWVKDKDRTSCHLCMRNFNLVRRKHHCRRCGEVICADCSVVAAVDLPVIGYSRLRLCKVCSLKSKSTPLKRTSGKHGNAQINIFDQMQRARSLSNTSATSPRTTAAMRQSYADTGSSVQTVVVAMPPVVQPIPDDSKADARDLLQSSHSSASSASASLSTPTPTSAMHRNDRLAIDLAMLDERHAAVHPIAMRAAPSTTAGLGTKETRRMSDAMLSTSTADCDDFLDERRLHSQLHAMEQQQQTAPARPGPSASRHTARPGGNSSMFELLCELACQTLNCPIASVSMVNAHGESIRSTLGLHTPELADELAIYVSEIMRETPTVVLDACGDLQAQQAFAQHSRLPRGPPALRFFAGSPIYSQTGSRLGYVCVADRHPRETLGTSCAFTMERLATLAVTTLERNLQQQHGGVDDERSPSPDARFDPPPPPPRQRHNSSLPVAYSAMSSRRGHAAGYDQHHIAATQLEMELEMERNGRGATTYECDDQYDEYATYAPSHAHLETAVASRSPRAPPPPPPANMPSATPRSYVEYTSAYYEAQQRMRKLLVKSYNTQQQLASGSIATMRAAPSSATAAAWAARFNSN